MGKRQGVEYQGRRQDFAKGWGAEAKREMPMPLQSEILARGRGPGILVQSEVQVKCLQMLAMEFMTNSNLPPGHVLMFVCH